MLIRVALPNESHGYTTSIRVVKQLIETYFTLEVFTSNLTKTFCPMKDGGVVSKLFIKNVLIVAVTFFIALFFMLLYKFWMKIKSLRQPTEEVDNDDDNQPTESKKKF